MSDSIKSEESYTFLERFLRLFARVRAEEGITSLLLLANIFLILMAYYFIKPLREGWLSIADIKGFTKLELKAYSAFGQSMLLILAIPLYAKLAAIWTRRELVTNVGLFFILIILVFWLLQPDFLIKNFAFIGIAFYLFVGVFSVTLVAQFWSFASDIYGAERGKRLFPLIAVGGSAGSACSALKLLITRAGFFEVFASHKADIASSKTGTRSFATANGTKPLKTRALNALPPFTVGISKLA